MRTQYAGKDDQDFLAMCLLMYAADEATGNAQPFLQQELSKMKAKIDKVIDKG